MQVCSTEVLDWVKALAPPLAALGGVWLAATRALLSFRTQKEIERRITWYETLLVDLNKATALVTAYTQSPSPPAEMLRDLNTALVKLGEVNSLAPLYADDVVMDVCDKIARSVMPLAGRRVIDPRHLQQVYSVSAEAVRVIGNEYRMGLRAVRRKKWR